MGENVFTHGKICSLVDNFKKLGYSGSRESV